MYVFLDPHVFFDKILFTFKQNYTNNIFFHFQHPGNYVLYSVLFVNWKHVKNKTIMYHLKIFPINIIILLHNCTPTHTFFLQMSEEQEIILVWPYKYIHMYNIVCHLTPTLRGFSGEILVKQGTDTVRVHMAPFPTLDATDIPDLNSKRLVPNCLIVFCISIKVIEMLKIIQQRTVHVMYICHNVPLE